ncbi:MAG: alpha/beta hydrolase [Saprospiraceae bacterium]|nr:alpha/beta hydrolase [Candidatus Vicinibacter affinis]
MHHAGTLDAFIQHLNPGPFHLVVHDFGGPIGLNFAINHPELIKSVTVLNSWLWNGESDPDFQRFFQNIKKSIAPLYKYLNFSPYYLLPNSFGIKSYPVHCMGNIPVHLKME